MAFEQDFAEFWTCYPRKIGKLAAQRAYVKARKVASADAILVGVAAYVRHMPADPQFRCHPATFLNQGRWLDEYDEPARVRAGEWCHHTPRCHSPDWHMALIEKETAG